jgi:hypothetical protein
LTITTTVLQSNTLNASQQHIVDPAAGTMPPRRLNILSPDEMMARALDLIGYDHKRQASVGREKNEFRFTRAFGSHPIVYANLWEDLLKHDIKGAQERRKRMRVNHFLMTVHFLRKYPTEDDREALFNKCTDTVREQVWFYVERIRALKKIKVIIHNAPATLHRMRRISRSLSLLDSC